ncbi:hypothetical protein BN946_scf184753.g27 [Trametes cinnabarina]|uniref:Uncharacterized protein n=1 Tax=Pycnoporus cinnabarinus TaxID=5643 RepID=A0A060SRX8_PYCCI|nr:hypothetical protein BN946_scf184753.g27 [Trametes cinnabarina]
MRTQKIETGPGKSLDNFIHHIQVAHEVAQDDDDGSLTMDSHPSSAAEPGPSQSVSMPSSSSAGTDVVSNFLTDQGLSATLAPILRKVGISDDSRIRALGTLPDTGLDMLQKQLIFEGLDFVACLLVRRGLRQRALSNPPYGIYW